MDTLYILKSQDTKIKETILIVKSEAGCVSQIIEFLVTSVRSASRSQTDANILI